MYESTGTRVRRGAALLDEKVPGWRDRVDVTTLSISSPCNCVVSQVFDGYAHGLRQLELRGDLNSQVRHGFEAFNGVGYNAREMTALTRVWKKELSTIRA